MLRKSLQEEDDSSTRNQYRVHAFRTAINAIQRLERPIKSADDIRSFKGVGPGISRRIQDYLDENATDSDPHSSTSTPRETLQDAEIKQLKEQLMQISGIGPKKAQTLIDTGCTSIDDLRTPRMRLKLSNAQLIGLDYFQHLQEPATRQEAEAIEAFIRSSLDPKFQVQLVGSYRRGSTSPSDIDIMLIHPSHVHIPTPSLPTDEPSSASSKRTRTALSQTPFHTTSRSKTSRDTSLLLNSVTPALLDRGLIAATLSSGLQKWQGIALIPEDTCNAQEDRHKRLGMIERKEGTYRRLDISLVPVKSKGAALLSLTGDTEFIRHLRLKAASMGLLLNEYGLWRWKPLSNGVTHNSEDGVDDELGSPLSIPNGQGHWQLIKAETEESILSELGMDYVHPSMRNYEFILDKPSKKKRGRKPAW
ncbi:hypothetical protein ONZ45_g17362 [Pleurotus djamor]|nr:hypothetical protein ONZ45_g17362 [Pleurotus djamor]